MNGQRCASTLHVLLPMKISLLFNGCVFFDEKPAIHIAYPATKVVLLGFNIVSILNPFYFFQYLLAHHPNRELQTISPRKNNNLPEQILYFHKAVSHMSITFTDADSFISELEKGGQKQYFLETIAFISSLININNLYQRQLLLQLCQTNP